MFVDISAMAAAFFEMTIQIKGCILINLYNFLVRCVYTAPRGIQCFDTAGHKLLQISTTPRCLLMVTSLTAISCERSRCNKQTSV